MTTSRKQRWLRRVALGSVLALAGAGAATAASAAEIDTTQTGSIIIHKHENPGNGAGTPDGSGTAPNTPGVAGVVFEYCMIDGIDLFDGTNDGWDDLNAITAGEMAAAGATGVTTLGSYDLLNCASAPATNSAGLSQTPDLPLGPYFVREISHPANVVAPAAPFIVALPTPQDPTNLTGEWVYDVNVYPKNTVAEGPRKNIVHQDDNGVVLGAPIDYEVTVKIPALPAGEDYNKFIVTDNLDPRLDPDEDPSKITVKVFGGATFVQGTDYTFVWNGQQLVVTFLQAGLDKLVAGQYVVVGFTAAATEIGTIDNQALVNLNDLEIGTIPPGTPPGNTPTNIVTTRWGALELKKVNADNSGQGLSGAEFTVWMSNTDAAGCIADFANLTQVTVPGTTNPYVVTAGANGVVTIPGLWVGDTELEIATDGTVTNTTVPNHDFQQRCYVVQEIKAPAGFVLPTGAAALTEIVLEPGAVGTINPIVTITNKQQGVPALPLTGSDGQMILTIGGVALFLVAAGVIVFVVRRRRTATIDES
ncbi:SpaH/EbpB family LPXTG-anchored major pilin [Microbacterium sp. ZW T5_56]|uniref:SpaH/EbpB family LPXTG-anchored major pilin n=1 Tax=Microbacterium sp. ZW T5_56 TaxID=3378081 RepID=UPI0038555359